VRNGSGWYVRKKPEGERAANGGNAEEESPKEEKQSGPAAPFVLRPFVAFDPAKLKPREFLFGKHYQRRTTGGTVAPGGTGKSTLEMVEGISMSTARNLLGEQPKERLRVWYHNGEDNMDELNRRLAAICQYYNIPLKELEGWFFMTSGNEVPLRVAQGYNNLLIDHRLVKCITESIGGNRIDVATFDPWSRCTACRRTIRARWILSSASLLASPTPRTAPLSFLITPESSWPVPPLIMGWTTHAARDRSRMPCAPSECSTTCPRRRPKTRE
jgi:hypothetical protein